jgi:hypothetical protein
MLALTSQVSATSETLCGRPWSPPKSPIGGDSNVRPKIWQTSASRAARASVAEGERLLQRQHDGLFAAVSQRQMRDDCLPVTGRTEFCDDAAALLPDLGAAELGKARDYAVKVADRPQLVPSESEPATRGRFEIGVAFCRHRAGERPDSAVAFGERRGHGGGETLDHGGAAR